MFGDEDKKESKKGVSFTPNTITYTAKGDEADKVRKAKFGVVVHTQYHGKTAESMAADPHPDLHNFKEHPDVWTKHPAHDTSKINYSAKEQDNFKKHMEAAQKIHDESKYNELVEKLKEKQPDKELDLNFFPLYRS